MDAIDVSVSKRQLRWVGHIARMGYDRLPRKMLVSLVPSKRPIGAPGFTYGRDLYKYFKKFDIDKNDWHNLAHDCLMWNNVVGNG